MINSMASRISFKIEWISTRRNDYLHLLCILWSSIQTNQMTQISFTQNQTIDSCNQNKRFIILNFLFLSKSFEFLIKFYHRNFTTPWVHRCRSKT